MNLQQVKDSMSRELYGRTKEEAVGTGICVSCKKPGIPNCYSSAGRKEYNISGLCELCFDKITGGR